MIQTIDFAPLDGITKVVFRQVWSQYFGGVDRYFIPFFSPTPHHIMTPRDLREVDFVHNANLPSVPQVMTKNAEDFLWASQVLRDMGYTEINLNLGCPSGTVTAKGKGAGMLGRPEELDHLLEDIFSASPTAVSVKTRLGIQDPEEFWPILDIYNKYPIAQLIVHTRVREDLYRRPARPELFPAILAASHTPLCYNGDLVTAADCRAFSVRFPGVGLMMGRGLVADPALASKAKGGPGADRDTLRAFHDALYEGYARDFGSRRNAMLRMKELWSYLIHLFRDPESYAKKLRKAADPAEFEALTAGMFRELELLPGLEPGFLF